MKNFWKKQNNNMKVAIIGGIFSIVVALIGILGVYISRSIDNTKPTITTKYTVYGGERFLIAQKSSEPEVQLDIVTSSCLETLYGEAQISTNYTESKWKGHLLTLIISNSPIIITEIELDIIDYQPIEDLQEYSVHYEKPSGFGGGGGFFTVEEVTTPIYIESREHESFNILLNQSYELPANSSVSFATPITVSYPGVYSFRVYLKVSNYSKVIEPTVIGNKSTIEWLFIPTIRLNEVKEVGDYVLRECDK